MWANYKLAITIGLKTIKINAEIISVKHILITNLNK
jgi:hypothetical protein